MAETLKPGPNSEVTPRREGIPVGSQIDRYLASRRKVTERLPSENRFLAATYAGIVHERNNRSHELKMVVPEVLERVQALFPNPISFSDCIDSRVSPTIKYGMPSGGGDAIHRPAGDMPEFVRGKQGGLVLLEGSYFEGSLDRALRKGDSDRIVHVFDSHVGCAARKGSEEAKGKSPIDGGLLQDVQRKAAMAEATIDYVYNVAPRKDIQPLQTSFDPHTGYLFMGLETPQAMTVAESAGGFTPQVLETLALRKKILHSRDLLHDGRILKMFNNHYIEEFSWTNNYGAMASLFWGNMQQMVGAGLLDHIEKQVRQVFLDNNRPALRDRSLLLALNAYNAYHLNYEGSYPHSEHKESYIAVSVGENGPYKHHSSFSVFSKAPGDYSANIGLAATIVRGNRSAGRISDDEGLFAGNEFIEAPVPVLHQVVVQEDIDWKDVQATVWKDGFIPEEWYRMDTDVFRKHVSKAAPTISLTVFNALNTLRTEMAALYDPTKLVGSHIFDGQLEILPALVDKEGEIHAIVPLVHKGYPRRGSEDVYRRN